MSKTFLKNVISFYLNFKFELLIENDTEVDSKNKRRRGLGTDLSIVSSMVFVAQFILSVFIGPLMTLIETKTVVIYAASIFAACASLSSTRVLYFD